MFNSFLFRLGLIAIPLTAVAQERLNAKSTPSYYSDPQPYNDYSTPDYYYHSNPNARNINREWHSSGGSINFGRGFDNEDNFTSGISSYQGTSTGPGPNGGYPGTPRGVYPTNYVDTSVYPNYRVRNQFR